MCLKIKNKKTNIDELCMIGILGCCGLTGLLPQKVLSIIVIIVVGYMSTRKRLFQAYPVMIFYYAQLGIIFGVSVYRIYTMFFILMTIIKFKDKLFLSKRFLAPVSIFIIYNVLTMSKYSFKMAFFSMLDVIAIILLINFYLNNAENLKSFFRTYVIVALLSFVTGIITNNTNTTDWSFSGQFVQISRFQATFEDANYMGFFFSIAIVAILTLELFGKKLRTLILIVLTGMIITTLSMTAIIANIFIWSMYLILTKKINIKTVITCFLVFILCISLYKCGLAHREIPVIGDLSYRIEDKVNALLVHDYATVTTDRTKLSSLHLEYFLNQGILKQLLGGNLANTYVIKLGNIVAAAHNDYIDLLLNIGVIGSSIMFLSVLRRLWVSIKEYKRNNSKEFLFVFTCKCVWLYYLATLTTFLDFRFMFALFI